MATPAMPRCPGWPRSWACRRCSPTTTTNLALTRDAAGARRAGGRGIAFHTFKDQVIFERQEVLTQAGQAVHGLHALQECLAQAKVDDFYLQALPGGAARGALAPVPDGRAGAVAGRARLSSDQPAALQNTRRAASAAQTGC
jgi:deoxyribodipyrimidine photolyase